MIIQKTAAATKAGSIFLAGAALIMFSQSSREGVSAGVAMCLNVLVPSLFPLMAVTDLFVASGLCEKLGKPLNRVTHALFGVSGSLAPVILMGLIGGYPVGASGIAGLYRQRAVSKQEAEKAALFTVCAGPGFLINFVGTALYGSMETGLVLYAAQVLAVLITGVAARFLYRGKEADNSIIEIKQRFLPFSQALVEAVYAAAKGMLTICAFVLLFSAGTGILAQLLTNKGLLNAVYVLLEVCTAVSKLSGDCPIAVIAFAVGFGGLCVHCQIFSALGNLNVSKPLFFLFRIIQGLLTALFTECGLRLLPQPIAVFSTMHAENAAFFGGSVLSGAAVVGVMICFLIVMKQQIKQ